MKQNNKPLIHVAAGLIWSEGRVLITKRPEGCHLEGYWEFPGGKQEPNETIEECLEREIKEELGMTVRAGRHIMTVMYDYQFKKISLHMFDCLSQFGNPEGLENQDIRWVRPVDLAAYQFPPPDQEFLDFLIKHPDLFRRSC